MPNRKQQIGQCVGCGRARVDGERFSARGKCPSCGHGRMIENVHAMRARSGPSWLRWRRAMAASVGGQLVDDKRERG
jgi:predicted RNA-binding Zn-ribbon protein involved in translation (DUF1610 family)